MPLDWSALRDLLLKLYGDRAYVEQTLRDIGTAFCVVLEVLMLREYGRVIVLRGGGAKEEEEWMNLYWVMN